MWHILARLNRLCTELLILVQDTDYIVGRDSRFRSLWGPGRLFRFAMAKKRCLCYT